MRTGNMKNQVTAAPRRPSKDGTRIAPHLLIDHEKLYTTCLDVLYSSVYVLGQGGAQSNRCPKNNHACLSHADERSPWCYAMIRPTISEVPLLPTPLSYINSVPLSTSQSAAHAYPDSILAAPYHTLVLRSFLSHRTTSAGSQEDSS